MVVEEDDILEVGRRRSGNGESVTLPRGAAFISICCIMEAQLSAASEDGIRAILRRFIVCRAGITVDCLMVSKIHSSSSVLGLRSTLPNVSVAYPCTG